MQYHVDSERRIYSTLTPMIGQDMTRVEAGTFIRENQPTEIYPLAGFIFDVLTVYATVEDFVRQVVAPNDERFRAIDSSYHHSMSQNEIIGLGNREKKRIQELVEEVTQLIDEILGAQSIGIIYMLSDEQIVLSDRQKSMLVQGNSVDIRVTQEQKYPQPTKLSAKLR